MRTAPFRVASNDPPATDAAATDFWRRLAYRWFVEFNPLYLLSAALVLGGCFLLSRGLATEEDPRVLFAIALVSEVYAWCLVGGVALLTRIDVKRPAVMLALLVVLYQWDLTLHTETCAYLGAAGTWASGVWVGLFAAKLYGLAWALRLEYAKRVVAAALLAASGLAVGPHVVAALGARNAGALVAGWVFTLGALYRPAGVASAAELTPWAETVLRRATRAAWILSAALVGGHVLFWATNHAIALSAVLPVLPLLYVRRVRSESRMWAIVFATLAFVGLVLPDALSFTGVLVAAALAVRALAPSFAVADAPSPARAVPIAPYRSTDADETTERPVAAAEASVGVGERARALAGAVFALYLSAWTLRWTGGAWPAHLLALDAPMTVAVLLLVWRLRIRSPLTPLAACYGHLVLVENLLPAPRSAAEWGATSVGLGFALLGVSLLAAYRLRRRPLP